MISYVHLFTRRTRSAQLASRDGRTDGSAHDSSLLVRPSEVFDPGGKDVTCSGSSSTLTAVVMLTLLAFTAVRPVHAVPCEDVRGCVSMVPAPHKNLPHGDDGYTYGGCGDRALYTFRYCVLNWTLESQSLEGRRSEFLDKLQDKVTTDPGCFCSPGSPGSAYVDQLLAWAVTEDGRRAACSSLSGSLPAKHVIGDFEAYNETRFAYGIQCPELKAQLGWFVVSRGRAGACPPGTQWTGIYASGKHCARLGLDPEANLGEPIMCPTLKAGNPVHIGTGNKFQRERDYSGTVPFPLRFERYYNSDKSVESRRMGAHWRHSYDRTLADFVATVMLRRADGKALYYWESGGAWLSDPDVPGVLRKLHDETGNHVGWTYTNQDDTTERYDRKGRLIEITNRAGFRQTLVYDDLDRLATVTDPFARALTFDYDTNGRVASMVDPAANVYRYRYDSQGNLAKVIYPDATPELLDDDPTRVYHYEDPRFPAALTGITDETGSRMATWTYDSSGRAVSSAHAGGADRVEFTFNADGTTTVQDPFETRRTYYFETIHGKIRQARLDGGPCSFGCGARFTEYTYDENGYPRTRTNFNGIVTRFEHDSRGLELSRTEALGLPEARITSTEWHPIFRLPVRVRSPGRITDLEYDSMGRLIKRIETDAVTGARRVTARAYNALGLLESIDGPREDVVDVTRFAYDSKGNLTDATNALGQVTRFSDHDAHGRARTIEDPDGDRSTLEYDPRGRLVSRKLEDSETRFAYDNGGRMMKVTLPDATSLEYTYDDAGRLVATTDNLGNKLFYELDAAGNRTQEDVRDPNGVLARKRARVYNVLGHLEQELDGNEQGTLYQYDIVGNRVTQIDANDHTTRFRYDGLDRLIESEDPGQGITSLAYDGRDNVISVTDPRGLETRYTYDGLDNLIRLESPDTGVTHYTHDSAGNRLAQTDARGVTTQYGYDALNRLEEISYPNPAENVTLVYDEGEHGAGHLTRIVDESGETRFEFDARDNLISDIREIDRVSYRTDYGYDAVNRIVSMTYPDGSYVVYGRDARGQTQSVSVTIDGVSTPLVSDIQYAPFGPVTRFVHGNGLVTEKSYDLGYRLETLRTPGVQDLVYEYDGVGNINGILNLLDPVADQQFAYDELDRLVRAQGAYGDQSYEYDAVGNRLAFGDSGMTDHYTYESTSNRLIEIAGPNGQGFAYDENGNTVVKGLLELAYNQANRMSTAERDGSLIGEYLYNAKGERVRKIASGTRTDFVYDKDGKLIAEFADDGSWKQHVYLDGEPVAMLTSAKESPPAIGIISPAPGTTLEDKTVRFDINGSPSKIAYGLFVGKQPGGNDIYQRSFLSPETSFSVIVSGIPLDVGEIYVSFVIYGLDGMHFDYTYPVVKPGRPARLLTPPPNTLIESGTITFEWEEVPTAIAYKLKIGRKPGSSELADEVVSKSPLTVTDIPLDGRTMSVSLASEFPGGHEHISTYEYPTTLPGPRVEMLTPTPGTVIESPDITFEWKSTPRVSGYAFMLGTEVGRADLRQYVGSSPSVTVTGIPLTGRDVHATLLLSGQDFGIRWRWVYRTANPEP